MTTGLLVPAGILSIVLMMVVPLPPFILDTLLALSLAIAVGVFLIALFVEEPLDYSVFPAVVLVATLLRLALNVATTRQILMNGADGEGAAGRIVATFGRIVVGGNVFVGLVVFLILVIINFVVITKGAGRVAEVAARFTLDAMPGKQMAIDADLNAGLVSAQEATRRRQTVAREADFFGAMDGASKFVQGDAIAGLLITGINLVGGLVVGVSSGLDVGQAAETFSILSIGDALVSQIPALLISTAAGIVVTRSATGEQLGKALASQVLGSRQAVALTAGTLALFGLLPGMPGFPFFAMAGALGFVGWRLKKREERGSVPVEEESEPDVTPGSTEDVETALAVDVLALEVGYELVSTVDPSMGGTLVDRIAVLRRQCAEELGFVVPPVRLRDNLSLEPSRVPRGPSWRGDRAGTHQDGPPACPQAQRNDSGHRRGADTRPGVWHGGQVDSRQGSGACGGAWLYGRGSNDDSGYSLERAGAFECDGASRSKGVVAFARCVRTNGSEDGGGVGPELAFLE